MPLQDADGYTITRDTYRLTHVRQNLLRQRIQTEVGDAGADIFRPVYEMQKWGGHAGFSLRLPELNAGTTEQRVQSDREISWRKGLYEARFYDMPNDHVSLQGQNHDGLGGYEFEIWLHRRPPTNEIPLEIEKRNCTFWFQPEATARERALGEVPINVEFSYAVSIDRSGGHFRTGVVAHLFRPQATDMVGRKVWCRFKNDAEQTGVLTTIVPQDFIDTAVYPIIIDPLFGYNTSGSSQATIQDFVQFVGNSGGSGSDDSTGSLGANQTITGLHAYCLDQSGGGSSMAKMGVYLDPAQSPSSSHTLTGSESSAVAVTSDAQYNFDATPTLLSGSSYVVAFIGDTDIVNQLRVRNNVGGFTDRVQNTEGSFSMPANLGSFTADSTRRMSIWGDYVAEGGAVTRQVLIS